MKKFSDRFLISDTKVAINRFSRRLYSKNKRRARNRARSTGGVYEVKDTIHILAPQQLCIYGRDRNKMFTFVDAIRSRCKQPKKIRLDFRGVNYISAAGMLLLLSTIDQCQRSKGFRFLSYLPKIDKMRSIFNQTGLTDILGKKHLITEEYDDVSFWNFETGTQVDGELLDSLVEQLIGKVAAKRRRKLFSGLQEAISNSVEHAYTHYNRSQNSQNSRWWAFGGTRDGNAVLLVCDLGLGIPRTVKAELSRSWLREALNLFGGKYSSDADLINAATRKGETMTQDRHRGHGLAEIKKFIESSSDSLLGIHSNKGVYRLKTTKTSQKAMVTTESLKKSMKGTIIEWQIPIEENLDEKLA